jgi:hypothetical protein
VTWLEESPVGLTGKQGCVKASGVFHKTLPYQPSQDCGGDQKNGKAELILLNFQNYICVLSEDTLERLSR